MAQSWTDVVVMGLQVSAFWLGVREWKLSVGRERIARIEEKRQRFLDCVGRGPAARFTAADEAGHRKLLARWDRAAARLSESIRYDGDNALIDRRTRSYFLAAILIAMAFALQLASGLIS